MMRTLPAEHLRRADDTDWAERRRRALEAAHTATRCGECARQLAAEEPVWVTKISVRPWAGPQWPAPVCRDCRRGERWLPTTPCEGCGRDVTYRTPSSRRHHAFCSRRCAWRFYDRRRDEVLALARRKSCAACARPFTATRRDARTCSPACRQRAYRTRLAGRCGS